MGWLATSVSGTVHVSCRAGGDRIPQLHAVSQLYAFVRHTIVWTSSTFLLVRHNHAAEAMLALRRGWAISAKSRFGATIKTEPLVEIDEKPGKYPGRSWHGRLTDGAEMRHVLDRLPDVARLPS